MAQVDDGSELVTDMFSWGHQGLMVYSDWVLVKEPSLKIPFW